MSCKKSSGIDFVDFLLEREDPRYAEFRAHYPGCSECAEQVGRLTRLEQGLGHSAPGLAGPHPAEETLLAYAEAPVTLDFEARRILETHLEACSPCRTELSVLERFDFADLGVTQTQAQTESPSLWQNWGEGFSSAAREIGGWISQPAFVAAALAILILPLGWLWLKGGVESPTATGPTFASQPVTQQPVPGSVEILMPDESTLAVAEASPSADASSSLEAVESTADVIALADASDALGSEKGPILEPATQVEGVDDDLIAGPAITLLAAHFPDSPIHYGVDQIEMLGGGSVRTQGRVRAATPGAALEIWTLAPDHVGWTSESSPTLYFWLSEPTALPIEVTVADDVSIEPLLEFQSAGPRAAGLHAISLAQLDAQLEPGVVYRWQVSAVPDAEHRSRDIRAGAAIVWQVPDAGTSQSWQQAGAGERAHHLAEQGYWYDAFAQLSDWMDAKAPMPGVQEARASLLEQADLEVHLEGAPQ